MNDASAAADLGDPPPPSRAKRSTKPKAPKAAKAKEAKAPKKSSPKPVEELVNEFESDQRAQAVEAGKNLRGIEGSERAIRQFIIDINVVEGDEAKLRGRKGSIVKEAKKLGVPVDLVRVLLKELKEPEESAARQNTMNQLRALVGMPHAPQIDEMSTYEGEAAADRRAFNAGQQCVWRGGRIQDNPYHGDVQRGQEWLKGFNEAHALAEAASSAAQMRKLNSLAAERAKEAAV